MRRRIMKGESMEIGWSPQSAASAYLDTLKLCKHDHERRHEECKLSEPESNEFISALAAGMGSQLIVEVTSEASLSTIALAAAARQTGGRLVCILPEQATLLDSKEVIKESGLKEVVEFKVGDPYELLPKYENIDFSLVDCKPGAYRGLLDLIDVNPKRSVVVANNLDVEREGLNGCVRGVKTKNMVRSMKHPIGNGMEVTIIGKRDVFEMKHVKEKKEKQKIVPKKSKWITEIDESGEEHIFRLPIGDQDHSPSFTKLGVSL